MNRLDGLLCALLLSAGCLLGAADWKERGGRALIHDENAYRFQARTLLTGRLCADSPPLPEFFETAHVLVVPRFCSKYYPGHALLLAPFAAFGATWLWSCLSLGCAAALLFSALRLLRTGRVAALSGALLFLSSSESLRFWATDLSHCTSGLCVAAALAAAAWFAQRPSAMRAAALGACAGYALLTRPFVGLALAAAGALAVAVQERRFLLVHLAPILLAAVCVLAVNRAVTGSAALSPWQLYAQQYTPGDGPGFGAPAEVPPLRVLPPHLQPLASTFRTSRAEHTLRALPAVAWRRFLQITLDYPPSALALPFAAAGVLFAPPTLIFPLAFAALFFVLQLFFHARNSFYLCELWPPLALVCGIGLHTALREIARVRGDPLRHLLNGALALPGLLIALAARDDLRGIRQAGATEAMFLARVDRALEEPRRARGLVFLRYPRGWHGSLDLTLNEPILAKAELVRALDLGPRDAELQRYFPERPAYLLDLGSLLLTPLAPVRP